MRLLKPSWVAHDGHPVFSVDIHPDGSRFATGGQGVDTGRIVIWNMAPVMNEEDETNKNVPKLLCQMDNHLACVNCVRWSCSGKYLASGGDDKVIMIWQTVRYGTGSFGTGGKVVNVEHWRCTNTLRGHSGDVLDLSWSPHDAWLASCSVDNTIVIWNCLKWQEIIAILKGHTGLVKGVSWDPVGKYVASQSDDKTLRVWRTHDWQQEALIEEPFQECGGTTHVLRLSWSPNGQYLVSAHAMNNSGPTAQIIEREGWKTNKDFVGHRKAITCVRFNPNILTNVNNETGKQSPPFCCCAIGSRDRSLSIWKTCLKRPLVVVHDLFSNSILDIAWTRTGYHLLVCSSDGTVAYVDFTEEEIGKPISGEEKILLYQRLYGKSLPLNNQNVSPSTMIIENPGMLKLQEEQQKQERLAKEALVNSVLNDVNSATKGMELVSTPTRPSIQIKGPTDKQIETRMPDGRRRITPLFIPPTPDSMDGPLPFNSQGVTTFSSSTETKSKIVIEKRDESMGVTSRPSTGSSTVATVIAPTATTTTIAVTTTSIAASTVTTTTVAAITTTTSTTTTAATAVIITTGATTIAATATTVTTMHSPAIVSVVQSPVVSSPTPNASLVLVPQDCSTPKDPLQDVLLPDKQKQLTATPTAVIEPDKQIQPTVVTPLTIQTADKRIQLGVASSAIQASDKLLQPVATPTVLSSEKWPQPPVTPSAVTPLDSHIQMGVTPPDNRLQPAATPPAVLPSDKRIQPAATPPAVLSSDKRIQPAVTPPAVLPSDKRIQPAATSSVIITADRQKQSVTTTSVILTADKQKPLATTSPSVIAPDKHKLLAATPPAVLMLDKAKHPAAVSFVEPEKPKETPPVRQTLPTFDETPIPVPLKRKVEVTSGPGRPPEKRKPGRPPSAAKALAAAKEARVERPTHTPATVHLPPLKIEKSNTIQVSNAKGESVNIDVENAVASVGSLTIHRMRCSSGTNVLWEYLLSSRAAGVAGSRHLACLVCEDATLTVFTLAGRRMAPPIVLSAPATRLNCSGYFVLVITSRGHVSVWDMQRFRVLVKNESLLPVMQGETDLTIRSTGLTEGGAPLVCLSTGKSYVFGMELGAWLQITNGDDILNHCSDYRTCLPPHELLNGTPLPLASLQGQVKKPTKYARTMFLESPSMCQAGTLSHLDSQVVASLALHSSKEYKFWLMTLVRYLTQEGLENHLREICSSLLGPIQPMGKNNRWEPYVLGMHKRDILQEVLPIIASNLRLQRLVTEYKDQLDVTTAF